MSNIRRNAKRDANEPAIINALIKVGCKVYRIMSIERGCPDLLVFRDRNVYALEVKTKTGKLSEKQKESVYQGAIIVTSALEAISVVTR